MTFNTPNVSDILTTLIGNDALISALKENGALITREKLLNEYHKSIMVEVVREANLRNLEMMQDIAELILANEEHIRKESIWQLTAEEFLFKEIRSIFGLEKANDNLYQSIFYCYKYCYVSSFFQNNADKFIPECDLEEIKENPAAEAFLDAMLKEFDKINRLLEETKDYLDYDKIPWDYIVYLTQLLGLEKDLLNFDDSEEEFYRELAKNILDIYRIKGTTYSYKLFFNFLGIDIEIKEFFFDRRYFYAKYPQENTDTGTSDKYSKDFYLTTINPSYNLNPSFSTSEIVTLNDFSKQENLKDFEELVTKYGLEAVLGYSKYDKNGEEYTDRVYKYFKTNYIYYYASALGGKANLTSKQISSLAKYLDFLTPIFVMRDIKTVAYSMSDSDSIAFDGDNGDRKYGALIDGTYEGFQMLDGECWDTINKDLYLAISDDGENRQIYYAKNGKEIDYRNSLPEWNDVDTKTFRQPLEFSAMSIYTSRYLGYERYYDEGKLSVPRIPTGRRVKFYSYNDENGTVYKYSTPPKVAFDVAKTSLDPIMKPTTPKIWSTKGRDSVRNEIEKNNYYKEIRYVINSNGNDVNSLLNSGDASMSELLECSWKENLLSYNIKSVKTTMLNQEIGGTVIGNTAIRYPTEYENNAEAILNTFNIVLFTGKHIENPKTEAELYLESIYVNQEDIKKHLVVGDYYVKRESGKYNIYRCCYENKKVWFLSKLFPDYKTEAGVVSKDQNNAIQLSGNFKTERNFSNALKSFFSVCMMEGANIDRYSHLYKIGGARGYYYAPTQIYTEVFGEDGAKPSGLVELPKLPDGSPNPRGYYVGTPSLVGKTFFKGISISYDNNNVEEDAVKDNMRYICFWDRQIGDLVYDEYDGKLYTVYNYGPKGLLEVKFNGTVKKLDNEKYALFEFDNFWKGYDEEADSDDFIAYNNEHIINWFEVGIHRCKWHRPIKLFTDKLYDNKNGFRNNFNNKLFYLEEDLQGEKSFKKMLLRDIWRKSYESFSEDLKNEFVKNILDVSDESDDNPETDWTEGYNTEELFTKFYGLITRDKENKNASFNKLANLIKDSVKNEHYDLTSNVVDNEVQVKDLFKNEWLGFGGYEFDKYYNFSTKEWEDADVVLPKIESEAGAYKNYRTVDINNNVSARACFLFSNDRIKDDYGEYTSSSYLMLDLINNCLEETVDDFLKDYFYDELLKRYREAFISDDNGMEIDSNDYGLFQGMPTTVEKWNGKGGKFAAPKILNSQFLNEGSDNYSSIKIPLKSIKFEKNTVITVPVNDRSNGNRVVEKPSTNIIFTLGFGDWYYNVREIFGINSIRDFSGRLIYGENASDAIAELRENYIKCFSPVISFPEGYSSLKYFKDEIEVDYNNNYSYTIWYVPGNGSPRKEISSIEQGVVSVYYNGSWVDWEAEQNEAKKKERLKTIFNKSVIEITVNNISRNPYLTKKRFAKVDINRNINVLSECPEFNGGNAITINRNGNNSVGYITLKYLRHKFRDNYISIPNSLDWIKIKNGKKDEYTSYGDDREVASKTINHSVLTNGEINQTKLENKIKLFNEGGVLNLEDGSIVENYERKSNGKIIDKSTNTDITNKAKYIEVKNKEDVFADKIIDSNGDVVLKIKNFSLSDIKQIWLSFRMIFVKISSKVINIGVPVTYMAFGLKRDVHNLLSDVKQLNVLAKNFIKRIVYFNDADYFNDNEAYDNRGVYNVSLQNNIINTFKYYMYCTLRRAYLVRINAFNSVVSKFLHGTLFYAKEEIGVLNLVNRVKEYLGRFFYSILINAFNNLEVVRHIGRFFYSITTEVNHMLSNLVIFHGIIIDLRPSEKMFASCEINRYFLRCGRIFGNRIEQIYVHSFVFYNDIPVNYEVEEGKIKERKIHAIADNNIENILAEYNMFGLKRADTEIEEEIEQKTNIDVSLTEIFERVLNGEKIEMVLKQ